MGFNNPKFDFYINEDLLEKVSALRDLGINLDSSLKPSVHIDKICSSARQKIAFLFKIFCSKKFVSLTKAYTSYIRPILEFNSPVWSPLNSVNIDKLEKVQKLFTRRVFSRCGLEPVAYHFRLKFLNLESLERRRRKADLCTCFSLVKGFYDSKFEDLFAENFDARTRGHEFRLHLPRTRTNVRKRSFTVRVVQHWNALSSEAVHSQSLRAFKMKLDTEFNGFRNLRWG